MSRQDRDGRPVVMVVHPDPDWASDLAEMLDPSAVVHVFKDPRAALAHVKENPPRLVLAALKMPFISGLELVQRLHREHQTIRCIVLACQLALVHYVAPLYAATGLSPEAALAEATAAWLTARGHDAWMARADAVALEGGGRHRDVDQGRP